MKLVISFLICVCCLLACIHDKDSKHNVEDKPKMSGDTTVVGNIETGKDTTIVLDSSVKIYNVGGDKYILLDKTKFQVPIEDSINTANVYKGIIDYRSGSLKRRSFLITKNLAYFTTFDDVGTGYRAYLYVFDLAKQSLIKDSSFKHDYLYSSAGIFVIDPDANRIFAVDKDEWYDAKGASIVPAAIYTIRGAYFKDLKLVYTYGEEIPSDTAVLTYFKSSISPASKGVYKLPRDWWKIKSHKYF